MKFTYLLQPGGWNGLKLVGFVLDRCRHRRLQATRAVLRACACARQLPGHPRRQQVWARRSWLCRIDAVGRLHDAQHATLECKEADDDLGHVAKGCVQQAAQRLRCVQRQLLRHVAQTLCERRDCNERKEEDVAQRKSQKHTHSKARGINLTRQAAHSIDQSID